MKKTQKNKQLKELWTKVLWISALVGIAALVWFSVQTHLKSKINRIELTIEKLDGSRNLISNKVALKHIESFFGKEIQEVRFAQLETKKLEAALKNDSRIEHAEVFVDGNNILYVNITQRTPIVRVMADNGEDYYLDRYGARIKTVKKSAVRVPVASGHIDKFVSDWKELKGHTLQDVLSIAKELPKDDFLQALIEQIYVERDGSITLIPKMGKQELIVGSTEKLKVKLRNIKLAYKTIVRIKGFDKYDKFIFEITNQIISEKNEKVS